MTCVISNRGTCGKCKGDKKHSYFHWELNYGLNLEKNGLCTMRNNKQLFDLCDTKTINYH